LENGPWRRAFCSRCSTPLILRLWIRRTVTGSFKNSTLKRSGPVPVGIFVSGLSFLFPTFQAVCCCINKTSLRSWAYAVSLVLTAPKPASVESLSNWMVAPGTSVVKTVRASTCYGTAR
jgi:hypothetical protein